MPRRSKKFKKNIKPDYKYNNLEVSKFINQIMRKGKKTVAQRIVYDAFEILKNKTKKEPLEIFKRALDNASPILEVKSKRIGGANYQIPIEVRGDRQLTLSMRWLIEAAKRRKGQPMSGKLAEELIAASNKEGEAITKKINIQKMAEANRAFAHFA